ncbi:MAG: DinB family protein [Anaerolineae bacterium]|nr:DinB family protein [Anaerolineae bacterium]
MTERFENRDMAGTVFQRVNLANATFDDANLGNATFSNINLEGATIHNANLKDMHIEDAYIEGLTILGFNIGELIEAEEDRRDPERVRLRMRDCYDPQCVRDMLARLEEIRDTLREKLWATDPQLLTAAPGPGRWCALEHVRHLLFAEELYLNHFILQNDKPLNPMGMLPEFLADEPKYQNVGTEPCTDLEPVLAAWDTAHAAMMAYLADMTPETLRAPARDLGSETHTVGEKLQGLAHHDLQHIRWIESVLSEIEK